MIFPNNQHSNYTNYTADDDIGDIVESSPNGADREAKHQRRDNPSGFAEVLEAIHQDDQSDGKVRRWHATPVHGTLIYDELGELSEDRSIDAIDVFTGEMPPRAFETLIAWSCVVHSARLPLMS